VIEDLLLPVGRVHGSLNLALELADLHHYTSPFVEHVHQLEVDLVYPLSQLFQRHATVHSGCGSDATAACGQAEATACAQPTAVVRRPFPEAGAQRDP